MSKDPRQEEEGPIGALRDRVDEMKPKLRSGHSPHLGVRDRKEARNELTVGVGGVSLL